MEMKMKSGHNILIQIKYFTFAVVAFLLCLPVMGCGGGDDDSTAEAGSGGSSTEAGGSDEAGGSGGSTDTSIKGQRIGSFQVSLVPEKNGEKPYTDIFGRVSDGVALVKSVDKVTASEGDCRLIEPQQPFCDPACDTDKKQECDQNETCRVEPTSQEVGIVTIKGLKTSDGATEFTIKPTIATTTNYIYSGELEYPPFAEGDEINISAAGSSYASAFSIKAKGISPFELLTESITLEDKDITLKWTKPTKNTDSKVSVGINITQHGAHTGTIECETADGGSLTVPAALVKKLIALGVGGFPGISFKRTSTGSAPLTNGGRVDLVIVSEISREIGVAGLTSCNTSVTPPITCPEGKTCDTVALKCK
jgi:hypothetical protein